MWGFSLDPKERFAVLLVKAYTKKPDRYEVSHPTLLRYDLAKKAVTDTIPWPRGEEREGAQIIFSPNGDLMYFFTQDDVLIYNTTTLKEVDRWEISKTLFEEGLGRINFGFPYDVYEEPGFYTGLFRTTDPVNRRTQMGVARMDLANRQLDYYPLGPSQSVSFRLSPDRKRAYGIHSEVGNYQFWTFDLESRRVFGKTEFAGRPRMGLVVSSNGSQLYITTAGSTIDRYSTNGFGHLGTVNLGADMTNVDPRAAARSPHAEIAVAVAGQRSSARAEVHRAALAPTRTRARALAREHGARRSTSRTCRACSSTAPCSAAISHALVRILRSSRRSRWAALRSTS